MKHSTIHFCLLISHFLGGESFWSGVCNKVWKKIPILPDNKPSAFYSILYRFTIFLPLTFLLAYVDIYLYHLRNASTQRKARHKNYVKTCNPDTVLDLLKDIAVSTNIQHMLHCFMFGLLKRAHAACKIETSMDDSGQAFCASSLQQNIHRLKYCVLYSP